MKRKRKEEPEDEPLTCRGGLRLRGSRSQNELALLAHLQLLPVPRRHSVGGGRYGVSALKRRVPHVVHLYTEGELMT